MDCCSIGQQIDIPAGAKKIVLAGNPNVGKSIFFNYFTSHYVDVSNYPGTTLDITSGKYNNDVVIDTPGIYGVSSFNDEEIVARDVITSADVIVNVVDAVHLERDLFLTQQLIDMDIPVVVALNMIDEAAARGLEIDEDRLSAELGVEVIPTVAPENKGFTELAKAITTAKTGNDSLGADDKLHKIQKQVPSKAEALLILEGDAAVAQKHNLEPLNLREDIYKTRRKRVNEVIDKVISHNDSQADFKTKLGRWMIKPLTGIPILLFALFLLYQFIGVFIAQTIVDFTEETVFAGIYEPFITRTIGSVISSNTLIGDILIGEFGVFTMTVSYIFGLLLPLIFGFYLFLSLLEDSGYLPRIAALVDRMLNNIGLNGRAIIPMILGFGCVTMATITTRLLGSKREKIIAVFLLGLAIPCSAQLGVIAGLIAPLGFQYLLIYLITLFTVYVLAGTFLNKVLPGKSTDLLIDLPSLRIPRLKNMFQKTYIKSKNFIKEASPIFAGGAVGITLMHRSGILTAIQDLVSPVTTSWLGLPEAASTAFIMGIIRRDFGAAGLTDLALTPIQTVVALITITLFVPCIAAMLIMIKERSWKEASLIWLGSWLTAFGVGGVIAKLLWIVT